MPNEQYIVNRPDKQKWEEFPGKKASALARMYGEYEMGGPDLTHIYQALGPQAFVQGLLQRKAQQQRAQEMMMQQLFGQYQHIINPMEQIMSRERNTDAQLEQARALQELQDSRARDIAGMNLQGRQEQTRAQVAQRMAQEQARQGRHTDRMGMKEKEFQFRQTEADKKARAVEAMAGKKEQKDAARAERQRRMDFMRMRQQAVNAGGGLQPVENVARLYGTLFKDAWQGALQKSGGDPQAAISMIDDGLRKRGYFDF